VKIIAQADLKKLNELERWRGLSTSTDFPQEGSVAAGFDSEASPFLTLRSSQ
jgi:hypothetical protein